jgi:UDP-N-acetylglucosamine diphosphorylase / glucose-1-phosphate thymidylyltransferase / UDP-N-acetylgalactosamine diphosphorylase / glucosamine-1-phosphate N-acetyltransferase / galactosamine-1-phosphate N-acetyltransferase
MRPDALNIVLYEDFAWPRLLPLVYTRPAFLLLCGMDTLWETVSRTVSGSGTAGAPTGLSVWVRELLAELTREKLGVPVNESAAGPTLLLNGRGRWMRLPDVDEAEPRGVGWVGTARDGRIACVAAPPHLSAKLSPTVMLDEARTSAALAGLPRRDVSGCVRLFDWPWQLVHANSHAIGEDWQARGAAGEIAGQLDSGVYLLNPSAIHIEEGTRVKPCVVIDAEAGPVWIGSRVRIQPHCYVEGPAYIGDGTLLQPGAVIRGGASVGPVCKVGGEVEGSVLVGYSNKQHDGFLGHSYVGSFVNIAADCINSDLKNTYGTVRVPINGREVDSGEQFVGLTVGDHSKAGINVSFPTGAVMGFCSSVVGPQSPKFVPSFAWIDSGEWVRYDAARGLAIAKKVMARRNLSMTPAEERAFLAVRTQALALEHASQLRFES